MELRGKKVAVIGLGKSGVAAAEFLIRKKARVRVTDHSQKPGVLESAGRLRKLGAQVETGGHTESFLEGSDLVVTSPGVPKKALPFIFAERNKIPVISEIELAYLFCKGTIVAVTGSNGKSTVCHLIHRILHDAGKKSVLCGNVGAPFLGLVSGITSSTVAVLELSSFQLEDSPSFRPRIAVVLNVSRNHLDRHGTFRNYVVAKRRIYQNQKKDDFLLLNHDDPVVRRMAEGVRSKVLFFGKKLIPEGFRTEGNFPLKGAHNLVNILAAWRVARLLGVRRPSIQKSIESFRTLEHRIEPVGSLRGVRFVNDSKSTTVESTKAAIEAVEEPVILVAGGRDKGASFGEIEAVLERKVKRVVLYGEAREKIARSFKGFDRCEMEENFERCVKRAFLSASKGDTILLSPMCSSFDQFGSFEERGEAFKRIFRKLRAAWNR